MINNNNAAYTKLGLRLNYTRERGRDMENYQKYIISHFTRY